MPNPQVHRINKNSSWSALNRVTLKWSSHTLLRTHIPRRSLAGDAVAEFLPSVPDCKGNKRGANLERTENSIPAGFLFRIFIHVVLIWKLSWEFHENKHFHEFSGI